MSRKINITNFVKATEHDVQTYSEFGYFTVYVFLYLNIPMSDL
jgi:hypothetical protein